MVYIRAPSATSTASGSIILLINSEYDYRIRVILYCAQILPQIKPRISEEFGHSKSFYISIFSRALP